MYAAASSPWPEEAELLRRYGAWYNEDWNGTLPEAKVFNGRTVGQSWYDNNVPQTAQIMNGNGNICAATYIGNFHFLGAAHCGTRYTHMLMGDVRTSRGTRFNITRVFQHPNYRSGSETNDIQLIRVNRDPSTRGARVAGVGNSVSVSAGSSTHAMGWGPSSFSACDGVASGSRVTQLQRVQPIVRRWANPIELTCNNCGTCPGDSGGPLWSNNFVLLGPLCCGFYDRNRVDFSFYTRTTNHVSWIRNTAGI